MVMGEQTAATTTRQLDKRVRVGIKRARAAESEAAAKLAATPASVAGRSKKPKLTKGKAANKRETGKKGGADDEYEVVALPGPKHLTEDEQKEVTGRTVFVGNVPLNMTENDVRKLLEIPKTAVETVRFRSQPVDPKFKHNRGFAAAKGLFTGTCPFKNCYLVMKKLEDVKPIIEKNGEVHCDGATLRITSVPYQRNTFSLFARRSTVFVGNLYTKVTEEDLRKLFTENVAPVKNVRIIRDPTLYISKGFGFVQFEDRLSVPKAVKTMNGFVLMKRPLNVTKAKDEAEVKEEDRHRRQYVKQKIQLRKIKKTKKKVDKMTEKKAKKKLSSKRGRSDPAKASST